jgi:hypothetical protein
VIDRQVWPQYKLSLSHLSHHAVVSLGNWWERSGLKTSFQDNTGVASLAAVPHLEKGVVKIG